MRTKPYTKKMDSKTDFSSDSDYDEFGCEIPFVGISCSRFSLNLLSQLLKYRLKNDLTGTSAVNDQLLHYRTWCAASSLGGVYGQKLKDGCAC